MISLYRSGSQPVAVEAPCRIYAPLVLRHLRDHVGSWCRWRAALALTALRLSHTFNIQAPHAPENTGTRA
jgi:hypothetical protein